MIPVPMELPRCEEVSALVSSRIDGELDAASGAGLAVHLGFCARCARLAEELVATVEALHRLPPRAPRLRPPR